MGWGKVGGDKTTESDKKPHERGAVAKEKCTDSCLEAEVWETQVRKKAMSKHFQGR